MGLGKSADGKEPSGSRSRSQSGHRSIHSRGKEVAQTDPEVNSKTGNKERRKICFFCTRPMVCSDKTGDVKEAGKMPCGVGYFIN